MNESWRQAEWNRIQAQIFYFLAKLYNKKVFPPFWAYTAFQCAMKRSVPRTFWKSHATETFYGKSIFAFNHHAKLHIEVVTHLWQKLSFLLLFLPPYFIGIYQWVRSWPVLAPTLHFALCLLSKGWTCLIKV